MKKTIFHLPTCSTCVRLIREWNTEGVEMRDIRNDKITEEEIDHMAKLAGGYEPLFSRRAMKYKSLGLKDMNLTEADYRKYILEEETFLKRPVVIVDDEIFIGNGKADVAKAAEALER
ncbi:MAG: hypothetical protein EP346_04190 [Bacteroidetes bacterium]|uniref:Arsenate reductase n=1 Tax=Phaeocystidibacter marisrubri TaxID=1577780 RepID=A0A6L3ZFV1_9FLAO|nr:ArsC/Spx/MgsR family protein [Phaeocystidibacter marisrubri]KAB2816312.1 hypothetical protein F8C82_11550 [Phaeocystidibacter marisrubri]TNE30245.1 MAG: hypothetical protein EP346_04190 [Bacteroidota bacterium]GGH68398.1 hypothetical protein GCM10011318_08380 [Phaeocystidibacter marisrubri]